MPWGRKDERDPLDRALEAAAGLKAGSWESVETLAMLSIEARDRSEAKSLYEKAETASTGLASGSWDSIRALTWLVRARRKLPFDSDG